MRLVYLSPVPWESFSQRPHHFVNWFHRRAGAPVIWIDPYPTRFPRWRDFRRLRTPPTSPVSANPPWLTVLKPGGIPIEPLPGSGWVNGWFWRCAMKRLDEDSETWLVIGKPSVLALALLDRYRPGVSMYDVMDDFSAFYTGLSKFSLARRERSIVRRVDFVWASSSRLRDRWSRCREDVQLVPNGLDPSVLPGLQARPGSSEKKVFGYVGTMAAWFDWAWVRALASARPDDEVRLIGPVFEPPGRALPDNVVLLPPCDHASALSAMTDFDVGLIPFKVNQLTDSVDPIKYYEYAALALPVISTAFGEMRHRSGFPGVFLSVDSGDVAPLAKAALAFEMNPECARTFARENSWGARFDAARAAGIGRRALLDADIENASPDKGVFSPKEACAIPDE